jgi:hypothetical protein
MTDVAFECANARVFTILVVDDEELVRMNACELLEAAGFIVCERSAVHPAWLHWIGVPRSRCFL